MNNNALLPLILIGGGVFVFLRGGGIDELKKGTLEKIDYKIKNGSVAPLASEINTIVITLRVAITNDNFFSILINSVKGIIKFEGNQIATFEVQEPTNLEAKKTVDTQLNVYVDVSSRGLPASIRTIFRRGTFDGLLFIQGELEIDKLGTKKVNHIVEII